jgi:hypothetical protein
VSVAGLSLRRSDATVSPMRRLAMATVTAVACLALLGQVVMSAELDPIARTSRAPSLL